jgi:hypothetical protein
MENELDLFEHLDQLPQNVLDVLNRYSNGESYQDCANLITDLNKIGYTCEYYLDAVPFGLRKL